MNIYESQPELENNKTKTKKINKYNYLNKIINTKKII